MPRRTSSRPKRSRRTSSRPKRSRRTSARRRHQHYRAEEQQAQILVSIFFDPNELQTNTERIHIIDELAKMNKNKISYAFHENFHSIEVRDYILDNCKLNLKQKIGRCKGFNVTVTDCGGTKCTDLQEKLTEDTLRIDISHPEIFVGDDKQTQMKKMKKIEQELLKRKMEKIKQELRIHHSVSADI